MGLNGETYDTVRSQIIQKEPMPRVKQVLAQICKEEQHKNLSIPSVMEDRDDVGIAFAAVKPAAVPPLRSSITCSHCYRSEHEIENFFQFVGYPDWWYKNTSLHLLVVAAVDHLKTRAEDEVEPIKVMVVEGLCLLHNCKE